MLNSGLLDPILDTDNGALPVLVAVIVCGVEDSPIVSGPKIMLDFQSNTANIIWHT